MGKGHPSSPDPATKMRLILAGGATGSISHRFSQQPPWTVRTEHPRVIREESWGTGQVSDRGLPQWKGKVCERDPFSGEALWEG